MVMMMFLCMCFCQDGRSAEIAAIRSGHGEVVEVVTRVNSVSFSAHT